jgi:hypothetical protein
VTPSGANFRFRLRADSASESMRNKIEEVSTSSLMTWGEGGKSRAGNVDMRSGSRGFPLHLLYV